MKDPTPPNDEILSFELAFSRLETILERMNTSNVSLDDSLKLFEEANKLIESCTARLNDAERKVEMLIKTRNGDLALNAELKPIIQEAKAKETI